MNAHMLYAPSRPLNVGRCARKNGFRWKMARPFKIQAWTKMYPMLRLVHKLAPWGIDRHLWHLIQPYSQFSRPYSKFRVRCHVTQPLGRNQKFLLRNTLEKVHYIETSIRFRWPIDMAEGHIWQFMDPVTMTMTLTVRKNLPSFIAHQPLLTIKFHQYQTKKM